MTMTYEAGYDELWMLDVSPFEHLCPICTLVPRNAVAHACGQIFCFLCWEMWKVQGTGCAHCRQPGDAPASNRDRRDILNLQIRCPAKCEQIYRLGDKEKHLKDVCPNRLVQCERCEQFSSAALMPNHEQNICEHRIRLCVFCDRKIKHKDMEQHYHDKLGDHLIHLATKNKKLEERIAELEKNAETTKKTEQVNAEMTRRMMISNEEQAALMEKMLSAMQVQRTNYQIVYEITVFVRKKLEEMEEKTLPLLKVSVEAQKRSAAEEEAKKKRAAEKDEPLMPQQQDMRTPPKGRRTVSPVYRRSERAPKRSVKYMDEQIQ